MDTANRFLPLDPVRIAAALLCGPRTADAGGQEPRRANIVLIVSDDQGYGDSTAYWDTDLQTPTIDGIARNGVRFTRFRVNPLCAPTRASFMTGLHSLEAGMWRGPGAGDRAEPEGGWPANARRIRDNLVMLPQLLKGAGYATGMFGKWHLGEDPKNVPNARGFDEFVGFLGGAHPYRLGRNSRILHNGKPLDATGQHTTDLFADRAIAFIRANKDRPFFCYLPFNAVHGPLRSPDRDADSAKPEWLSFYEKRGVPQPRRDYCAVMTHADAPHRRRPRRPSASSTSNPTPSSSSPPTTAASSTTIPRTTAPCAAARARPSKAASASPRPCSGPASSPRAPSPRRTPPPSTSSAPSSTPPASPCRRRTATTPSAASASSPMLRSGAEVELPDRYLFWDLYGQCGAAHGPWKLVGEIANHHGHFGPAADEAEKTQFALYNLDRDLGEKDDLSARFPDIYRDLKRRHVEWLRGFATPGDSKAAAPTGDKPAEKKERRKQAKMKKQQQR